MGCDGDPARPERGGDGDWSRQEWGYGLRRGPCEARAGRRRGSFGVVAGLGVAMGTREA